MPKSTICCKIWVQHRNTIESIYCHLSKFLCRPGDLVFAGNAIAISGASGVVTLPHQHFVVSIFFGVVAQLQRDIKL